MRYGVDRAFNDGLYPHAVTPLPLAIRFSTSWTPPVPMPCGLQARFSG